MSHPRAHYITAAEYQAMSSCNKRSKYGNVKTQVDGITFDSKREANRYCELKLMEREGSIKDLQLQVPYEIQVNGKKVCKYIADFVYVENDKQKIEDAKGKRTAVYQIKKKLMRAVHGIEIEEV